MEISGDGIDQRIADLENKNAAIILEEHRGEIEELIDSVGQLPYEKETTEIDADNTDSDNKGLVARMAELETEVSRLQQDLASATRDLKDFTAELSILKEELERKKVGEKLEALEKEKDLLLAKTEKTAVLESKLWEDLQGKEKEIRALKKNVKELEAVVGNGKGLEMGENDLDMSIVKMREEISVLQNRLMEIEKLLELKGRAAGDGNNQGTVEDGGGKKKYVGGVIVGGSGIAAVAAAIGVAFCTLLVRKH